MALTIPVSFADGQPLFSSQLNANFSACAAAYNAGGDTLTGTMNVNYQQLQKLNLESLASDPALGHAGRVWYDSALKHIKFEDGAEVHTVIDTLSGLTKLDGKLAVGTPQDTASQAGDIIIPNAGSGVPGPAYRIVNAAGTSTVPVMALDDANNLYIWVGVLGVLKRVLVGAENSGGAGYRSLITQN